jgi:HTH-type transcriptional regulator/antitoxin HipB
VDYLVKTSSQLRPLLVGFRKAAGFTQAQVALRLGVTQQTYAQLEARPESGSMERVFKVLRLLNVNMVLQHASGNLINEQASQPEKSSSRPVKALVASPTKKREDW